MPCAGPAGAAPVLPVLPVQRWCSAGLAGAPSAALSQCSEAKNVTRTRVTFFCLAWLRNSYIKKLCIGVKTM